MAAAEAGGEKRITDKMRIDFIERTGCELRRSGARWQGFAPGETTPAGSRQGYRETIDYLMGLKRFREAPATSTRGAKAAPAPAKGTRSRAKAEPVGAGSTGE